MKVVHVAVGVIFDETQQVLISRRSAGAHQGGLWEFPGGKVEEGESLQQALSRELKEELGIEIHGCTPLLQVNHDYGDKAVLLDVCIVRNFSGQAKGEEGQPLCWAAVKELDKYEFPAANKAIVDLLKSRLTSPL